MPVAIDLTRDESLPRYIIGIYGLDDSWKARARCLGRGRGPQKVWFQEDDHPGYGGSVPVTGHQLAEIALGECARCPVQWECVTWAIKGEQNFTIYADKAAARKWLKEKFLGDWETEIADAKERGETVRGVIVRLRKDQKAALALLKALESAAVAA